MDQLSRSEIEKEVLSMDKDQVKGKLNDVAGRVKRQTGEWTGDKELQAEGTKDQIKGKGQTAIGKVKDAARDAVDDLKKKRQRDDVEKEDAA